MAYCRLTDKDTQPRHYPETFENLTVVFPEWEEGRRKVLSLLREIYDSAA
jgi:hypothetical protein